MIWDSTSLSHIISELPLTVSWTRQVLSRQSFLSWVARTPQRLQTTDLHISGLLSGSVDDKRYASYGLVLSPRLMEKRFQIYTFFAVETHQILVASLVSLSWGIANLNWTNLPQPWFLLLLLMFLFRHVLQILTLELGWVVVWRHFTGNYNEYNLKIHLGGAAPWCKNDFP